jgi:hypothetical protein
MKNYTNKAQLGQRVAVLVSLLDKKDAKLAYLKEQFRLAQQNSLEQATKGILVRVSCLMMLKRLRR